MTNAEFLESLIERFVNHHVLYCGNSFKVTGVDCCGQLYLSDRDGYIVLSVPYFACFLVD